MTRVRLGLALLPVLISGCVVIPVGDLLKGPVLKEQILQEGSGLFSRDKIAILMIDGIISGEESTFLMGSRPNTVSEIRARLQRMLADPEIRGVVLRISSPGGEVTACDTIHHEVMEFKKKAEIPVVAIIVSEGASGGYYVASAADHIICQPTAVVGSIGVILQTFDTSGLLEKIGIGAQPIKSAEKKDLLSIFRRRTVEEVEILQKMINDFYQRFVDVVASREGGQNREEVLKIADGRIFSGLEAQKLGLVDQIGYVPDAIEEIKKRAQIERRPEIVHYTRIAKSGANVYSMIGFQSNAESSGSEVTLKLGMDALPRARFLYLWTP